MPKRTILKLTKPDIRKISTLKPENRKSMLATIKETLFNVEKARWYLAAYREDRECAFELLDELTFLIDELFATCISLVQLHPGVDDLGQGVRVTPSRTNFYERRIYGKHYLEDEPIEIKYWIEMQRNVDDLISAQARPSESEILYSRSKRSRAARGSFTF